VIAVQMFGLVYLTLLLTIFQS